MPWKVRQNEEINISNAKYTEGNLKHHSQSKHIICFCKENIPKQNAIQIYSKSKLWVKSCWHMLDNICFPCLFNLNLNLFRLFLVIIFYHSTPVSRKQITLKSNTNEISHGICTPGDQFDRFFTSVTSTSGKNDWKR